MTHSNSIQNLPPGIIVKQDLKFCFDNYQLISHYDSSNLEASSYDLRIGTIFKDKKVIKDTEEQLSIEPGEIINLFTLEEVNLPPNVAATVYPINSQSSRGLLVLNPGHIDPGYHGPITVKAINLRRVTLPINRGKKILTIIFYVLPKSTTSPYARNKPRDKMENSFNSNLIEQDTNNLSEIIALKKDGPYPTRQEVKELMQKESYQNEQDVERLIQEHWMSKWTLFLTLFAAIGSIVAAVVAILSLEK